MMRTPKADVSEVTAAAIGMRSLAGPLVAQRAAPAGEDWLWWSVAGTFAAIVAIPSADRCFIGTERLQSIWYE